MAPITTSTEIDRPAVEVFAYATDPTRFNQWQNGVVDGHMGQAGNPQVGAQCRTTRRIGGSNRSATSTITHRSTKDVGRPRHRRADPGDRGPIDRETNEVDDRRRLRGPRNRGVVVGGVLGVANGLLVTRFKLPPFIAPWECWISPAASCL